MNAKISVWRLKINRFFCTRIHKIFIDYFVRCIIRISACEILKRDYVYEYLHAYITLFAPLVEHGYLYWLQKERRNDHD